MYVAHQQWNALASLRQSLDKQSIITVEDYQMNIELEFSENPTPLAYSTNKATLTL